MRGLCSGIFPILTGLSPGVEGPDSCGIPRAGIQMQYSIRTLLQATAGASLVCDFLAARNFERNITGDTLWIIALAAVLFGSMW